MLEQRLEGSELQRLMEEQELTQRELAERAGVDDSVISLARRGKQRMSMESERKVAGALGVGVEELVDEDGRGSYRADSNSVRLVAGQREEVAYPETEDRTGEVTESNRGGKTTDLVSVAGLENRRTFKRLNQSELARRAGVNRATISQIEKRGRATRKTARLLASALGIKIEQLTEAEQRSRFPERDSRTVTYSEEGTISCSTDSSTGTADKERRLVRVELSDSVLNRVDRLLDLMEAVLRPRREAR